MAKVTGKALDVNLLARIFKYVKPYKSIFIWSVLLTISLAILAPLRPFLVQYTLDKFILENDSSGLIKMTLIMIGLLLVQTVVQYFHTFLTNILGQSVIKDLR